MHREVLTQYYHTRDPIENLRVRVVLRKTANGNGTAPLLEDLPVGSTWSYTFCWQERRHPSRTHRSQRKQPVLKSTASAAEEDTASAPASDVIMLCSYNDADNYAPQTHHHLHLHHLSAMSADLPPTHLIRAKARHNRTNDLSLLESNTDRVQRRIEREDIFKLMHLVARVADDEVLLCTLSFHVENGLLCMTPGFSAYCDVGTDPDAATKGPKLSTLTFKTERSGVAFEYALDNEHDLIPSVLPEDWQLENELRRLDIKQAQVQVAELVNRSGQGTANASIKPDAPRERRVAILMELVSLYGADADTKIYVDYELHGLSPQWKPQTTALDGQTQLSQGADIADIGNMHAFNFHVRYDLGWHNASKAPGTAPEADVNDRVGVVLMRAFACDSWKRKKLIGCGELHVPTTSGFNDVNVRLWKPVQSIREQMEDYFIGMDELVPRFDSHAHQQAFRSRLGLETESAACHLRVRLNVAIERPQEVSVVTMNSRDLNASLVPTTTQAVKRSVNEILQSLKLEKAMATTSDKQMKAALRSMSIGGLSAVNTVLRRTPNTSS